MNNVVFQGLTMQEFQKTSTNFALGYPNNPNRSKAFPNTTDPETNGSIDPYRYNYEPKSEGVALCASAFYALVTKTINPSDSDAVAQVIKPIMLAQVDNVATQFPDVNTNNARWHDGLGDTHCWTFTEFMDRYLLAYDYTKNHILENGTPLWTALEKTKMLSWFEKYANLLARIINDGMGALFPNRLANDLVTEGYSIISGAATSGNKWTHINGDGSFGNKIGNSSNFINNRRLNQNAFIGLSDLVFKEAGYVQSTVNVGAYSVSLEFCCKIHVKEAEIMGIYEDGSFAEHQRSSASDPQKGYHYSWDSFQGMLLVISAYARAGDYELLNYTTNRGYYYSVAESKFKLTTGATKSLFTALEWYISNSIETDPNKYRYFKNDTAIDFIQDQYRLYHKDGDVEYIRESRALILTHFWKSPKLIQSTTRTYQGSKIGSAAGSQDWWGLGELLPFHFMFSGLENLVYPYPLTKLL